VDCDFSKEITPPFPRIPSARACIAYEYKPACIMYTPRWSHAATAVAIPDHSSYTGCFGLAFFARDFTVSLPACVFCMPSIVS
jgi:hypothetical protein